MSAIRQTPFGRFLCWLGIHALVTTGGNRDDAIREAWEADTGDLPRDVAPPGRADDVEALRAEVERLREVLEVGQYERWDDSVAPGGMVCRVCGVPVESEPCMEHNPVAAAEAERDEALGRLAKVEARLRMCADCGWTRLECLTAPVKCCPDCNHPAAMGGGDGR